MMHAIEAKMQSRHARKWRIIQNQIDDAVASMEWNTSIECDNLDIIEALRELGYKVDRLQAFDEWDVSWV